MVRDTQNWENKHIEKERHRGVRRIPPERDSRLKRSEARSDGLVG